MITPHEDDLNAIRMLTQKNSQYNSLLQSTQQLETAAAQLVDLLQSESAKATAA